MPRCARNRSELAIATLRVDCKGRLFLEPATDTCGPDGVASVREIVAVVLGGARQIRR